MIGLNSRSLHAASPWMIAISVVFHAAMVAAVVAVSSLAIKPQKVTKEVVRRVTLVREDAGNMAVEKLKPSTEKPAEVPAPETTPIPREPVKSQESVRETVQSKSVSAPPKELIPLTKRGRRLKRVAVPKEAPKKEAPKKEEPKARAAEAKKEKAKPAQKESPESFLQKRLASIRKNLETKKHEVSSAPGTYGSKPGSGKADEELAQWLEEVRRRINEHWAVFGQDRSRDGVTVIGVEIADDGKLVSAVIGRSSGDPVFDRSAMRAVYQSAPFPAVPSSVREKIRKEGGLELRFTPGGMQ